MSRSSRNIRFRQSLVNAVTLARIAAAAMIIVAASGGHWLIVLILAVGAFASDWIDGWLARRWQAISAFGMFFDPLADKLVCLPLLWLIALEQELALYWTAAGLITAYDSVTMSLRLININKRSLPANRTAKLKTASLMLGLVVALLAILGENRWWGELSLYGSFLLLGGAALLAFFALSGYAKQLLKSRRTGVEQTTGVTEIDFTSWHKNHGIDYVLFDVEGTLTPWAQQRVERNITEALARARAAGIREFGLVSNMSARHKHRLKAVAKQIEAKTRQLPSHRHHRKPNPHMIKAAMTELEAVPENTGFVGDKLVDIVAARRAHLARVAWVKRHGRADQILDKLIYRPLEPLMKRLLR